MVVRVLCAAVLCLVVACSMSTGQPMASKAFTGAFPESEEAASEPPEAPAEPVVVEEFELAALEPIAMEPVEIRDENMDEPRSPTNRGLTPQQWTYVRQHDWDRWVGGAIGVWVSVGDQRLRVLEGDRVLMDVPCSTAELGTGSVMNSMQTPLGWHSIAKKLGGGAPWGQVFRARRPTAEVWRPGGDTKEDLVLTRVILLDGEEPGKNKGGNVDSRARYIYIHGTNAEDRIGQPASHGCVRLLNDDVIAVHDLLPVAAKLLITEP
jgi:hypothetical protein